MKKLNNDERFKHVNYHKTDVAATFARVRREQRDAARLAAKQAANVRSITRRKQG